MAAEHIFTDTHTVQQFVIHALPTQFEFPHLFTTKLITEIVDRIKKETLLMNCEFNYKNFNIGKRIVYKKGSERGNGPNLTTRKSPYVLIYEAGITT